MSALLSPKRLTFHKGERLKSRKTIQTLFLQNKSLKIYPFKLVWLMEALEAPSQLEMGVSVSKRLFKSAVKRNTIKRKLRECLRLNKTLIQEKVIGKNIKLSFMLIYIGNEIVSYNEFNTKIKLLLIRLGEKV